MAKVARLLEKIVPERYRLVLDVDMDKFRFKGTEHLAFELTEASAQLVLHAVGLDIARVDLDRDDSVKVTDVVMNKEAQTATIKFAHEVAAGRHELGLEYSGEIQDSLHGFYRSRYERDGKEHFIATTQFEPVSAREALVCVDEPAAKAVFELEMVVPDKMQAISNTNATGEEAAGTGRKRVKFAPTPKMSAYLLAFLVGEFEHVEAKTPEGVTVRAYSTPGLSDQLGFALECGVRGLSFYTDYFGIPYPLPKLDMIAVPDFAVGAMENWGAVIYRDTALLLDPKKTALAHKQRVAEVVLHEEAHMWFGDLVTMSWWNDLWLNEGFASWMEVLAMDKLFPEWEVWTQFVSDNFAHAMELDGLANTHPIDVEVNDPRALDEIFDAVSYSKGASIINMLHHFVGDEAFRRGLHQYLDSHQYGNTVTTDLWESLERASGKPVADMMSAWTGRPGYPILSFEDGQASQRRFYSSPREAKRAKAAPPWPVPLSVLAGGRESELKLMTKERADLPDGTDASPWFKPNPGQTGFYRSMYTSGMIEALGPVLADGTLRPVDRFGVVNDVVATTESGLTDSAVLLGLVALLRDESDYVVWGGVSGGLGGLESVVEDEPVRDLIDRFGNWLVAPNVTRLGWKAHDGESSFDTLMRPLVLQQAVRFDDETVTREARKRFDEYLAGGDVEPDLRAVALYSAARHGGAAEFDAILARYRKEQSPQVKMSLLASLGRFRKSAEIERFLGLGLSPDVRPQDIFVIIAWGFRNRHGRELAWQYVQDNWPEFLKRYGDGGHMLERFPTYAAWGFATHKMAAEIGEFFRAHPHPVLARPAAQAVEAVELKADWYERDKSKIQAWLREWSLKQK